MFSPTSLTGGGHDQLIRKRVPPPFGPGFWDGVGSPLNVGPCAHKRSKHGLSAGLAQMDADTVAACSGSVDRCRKFYLRKCFFGSGNGRCSVSYPRCV
jgi:hypothetical protein